MTILHSFALFCFIAGRFLASPPMYLFVRQWKRPRMLNQTMKGFLLAFVALGRAFCGTRKNRSKGRHGSVQHGSFTWLVEEVIHIH